MSLKYKKIIEHLATNSEQAEVYGIQEQMQTVSLIEGIPASENDMQSENYMLTLIKQGRLIRKSFVFDRPLEFKSIPQEFVKIEADVFEQKRYDLNKPGD